MMRLRVLPLLTCVILTGCFTGKDATLETDVTPPLAASGALIAPHDPPAPRWFTGQPTHIGFEPIPFEGGSFPFLMNFVFLPHSDQFIAVSRMGIVGRFQLERERAVLLDSFQIPAVFTEGDCGASSLTLDPEFDTNKLFYVAYCIDAQYSVIKRYKMSDTNFPDTLYSAANVFAIGDAQAVAAKNTIGTMTFGPDGALWANIGDHDRGGNAQDLTNELGKIIRLQPLRETRTSGYSLVSGNAFPDQPSRSSLIYSYGFHNPWRGAFDTRGRYWVADAGSTAYQEINVVTASGQNFGWPLSEGPVCRAGSCSTFVHSTNMWDVSSSDRFLLDDPQAKSNVSFRMPWVGLEYRPSGQSDPYKGLLTGKMLYGDFYLGYVRGIALSGTGTVLSDQQLGHLELPVSWQQGRDGYVYAGTMFASYDPTLSFNSDSNTNVETQKMQQGQLWRVIPLP